MLVLQQDVEDLTQDEETLPLKRSKHFADKDASAPKAARESAASTGTKRKSPAKPAAAKAAIEKAAAAKAAAPKATKASPAEKKSAKPAGKGRKAIVLDDDSDDDFQVCLLLCKSPGHSQSKIWQCSLTPMPVCVQV